MSRRLPEPKVYVQHPQSNRLISIEKFEEYVTEAHYTDIKEALDDLVYWPFNISIGEDVFEGKGRAVAKVNMPFMGNQKYPVEVIVDAYFDYDLPDFYEKGSYIYYVSDIYDVTLADVRYMGSSLFKIRPDYGTFKAHAIMKILSRYIGRWYAIANRILIVSSYIDVLGYKILSDHIRYLQDKEVLIVTFDKKSNKKYFKDFIKMFDIELKTKIQKIEKRYHSEEEIWNLYDYYNKIKEFFKDRLCFVKNLHAKIYAAQIAELKKAEVIVTSLNLIRSEIKSRRIESFSYNEYNYNSYDIDYLFDRSWEYFVNRCN